MSYALLRPFLFNMDPEHAHDMTLSLLDKAHKARVLGLMYGQSMQPTDWYGITVCQSSRFGRRIG